MTADEYLATRVGERLPAIRSGFDVYLVENRLFYVKEPCGQEDVYAPFFLHLTPVVLDGFPGPRRRHGFDNLDFRLNERVMRVGGTYLAEGPLPEYDIPAIRTGQYVAVEDSLHNICEGEIRFG